MGSHDSQNTSAGSDACADTRRGIFDHDAVFRGKSEHFGSAAVGFGIWFAALDHVSGDEARWNG
jgi:hypothetical protein